MFGMKDEKYKATLVIRDGEAKDITILTEEGCTCYTEALRILIHRHREELVAEMEKLHYDIVRRPDALDILEETIA